jgi:hypothetical protein
MLLACCSMLPHTLLLLSIHADVCPSIVARGRASSHVAYPVCLQDKGILRTQ